MQKTEKTLLVTLIFTAIIFILILLMQPIEVALFHKDISVLFAKGAIAVKERDLLFLVQIVMLVFVIPVYIMTFIFSWRYRATNKKAKYDPHLVDNKIAEVIWWGVPFVLTTIVAVIVGIKTYELDPYRPLESDKKTKQIEVVALQWRWLFIYPEEKIATLNTLHFPKGTPVHFSITADAPMNSFWIPDLGGQIYAMPGMQTELHLIADKEGSFRGSSANISGEGFAKMHFMTEATDEETYNKWVDSVRQSPQVLDRALYDQLALPSMDNSAAHYRLGDDKLFHQIMMKFMQPDTHE